MRLCPVGRAILILLASTSLLRGAETNTMIPLIVNKKPQFVLEPPFGSSDLKRIALDDLMNYVQKSTGAPPQVLDAGEAAPAGMLIVSLQVADESGAEGNLTRHSFTYSAAPQRIEIIGADSRGLANGVHWFLREKLGVRWYMPTEMGEEVPAHVNLTLKSQELTVEPEFEWLRFTDGEEVMWGARHGEDALDEDYRLNWHFQKNWAFFVPPTAENVRRHPEWFAREEGQLPVYDADLNVCVSNPDVVAMFIEKAKEEFATNPGRVMLSLEANDSIDYCRCHACRDLQASLGPKATMSDVFIHFCNQIVAEVKKSYPDKRFGFYAYASYGDHTYPPAVVTPDPSLAVLMTRSKYHPSVCYRHSVTDPACQNNAKWRENFEGWANSLDRVGVYAFWANYHWYGPEPLTRLIKDLPYYKSQGVQYVNTETGYSWATMAPYYYLTARLLQDTTLEADVVLDDFCRGMYGPAEKPMRRYWQRWIDAFESGPCRIPMDQIDQTIPYMIRHWLLSYSYDTVYTSEVFRGAETDLSEAARLVETAPDRYGRRVKLAHYGFRYTQELFSMLHHVSDGDIKGGIEAGLRARSVVAEADALPGPAPFARNDIGPHTRVAIEIGQLQDYLALKKKAK